jgi:NADH-quinone oxidoreductase subunit E
MSVLSEELRQKIRDEFPKYPNKRAVTLPALHIVHDAHRAVSIEAIREIAQLLDLHPAEVHDTMTFYNFFRTEEKPMGRHRVWVCRSISCALRGGEELLEEVSEHLRCTPGGTTEDGRYSLEFAECLGACEGAPCMLVGDERHVNLTAESAQEILAKLA